MNLAYFDVFYTSPKAFQRYGYFAIQGSSEVDQASLAAVLTEKDREEIGKRLGIKMSPEIEFRVRYGKGPPQDLPPDPFMGEKGHRIWVIR